MPSMKTEREARGVQTCRAKPFSLVVNVFEENRIGGQEAPDNLSEPPQLGRLTLSKTA